MTQTDLHAYNQHINALHEDLLEARADAASLTSRMAALTSDLLEANSTINKMVYTLLDRADYERELRDAGKPNHYDFIAALCRDLDIFPFSAH